MGFGDQSMAQMGKEALKKQLTTLQRGGPQQSQAAKQQQYGDIVQGARREIGAGQTAMTQAALAAPEQGGLAGDIQKATQMMSKAAGEAGAGAMVEVDATNEALRQQWMDNAMKVAQQEYLLGEQKKLARREFLGGIAAKGLGALAGPIVGGAGKVLGGAVASLLADRLGLQSQTESTAAETAEVV